MKVRNKTQKGTQRNIQKMKIEIETENEMHTGTQKESNCEDR